MRSVLDLAAANITQVLPPAALTTGTKTAVQVPPGGGPPGNFLLSFAGSGSAVLTVTESPDDLSDFTDVTDYNGNNVVFTIAGGVVTGPPLQQFVNANPYAWAADRKYQWIQVVVSGVVGTVTAGIDLIEGAVEAHPPGLFGSQTNYIANG